MNEPDGVAQAIPAASLILLRNTGDGVEVLAIRRGPAMRFAGGAWAFPGGRVDPADRLAATEHPDLPDAAFRIAALRETREEVAVAARGGVAGLTPYARWQPPLRPGRRFDTLFFLGEAEPDAAPIADGTEAVEVRWARPRAILDAAAGGHGHLLFPTRCLLERLAEYGTVADALADAARFPVRLIVTALEDRDGTGWLTIPDDLGYPFREQPASELTD